MNSMQEALAEVLPEIVVAVQEPATEQPAAELAAEPSQEVPPVEESLEEKIAKLQAQLLALTTKTPKNHVQGRINESRKYVLHSKTLASWGKVPQQQADIAKILADNFEVGKQIPESEVFAAIQENAGKFPSLANSRQDPTYVFKYYRGLKREDKHAGFIARGFLTVVG